MENASKALLIAGAVLIVLVLISVGVLLLGRTNDVTDRAGDTSNALKTTAENKVDVINDALGNL